jgi:hypothetical protein
MHRFASGLHRSTIVHATVGKVPGASVRVFLARVASRPSISLYHGHCITPYRLFCTGTLSLYREQQVQCSGPVNHGRRHVPWHVWHCPLVTAHASRALTPCDSSQCWKILSELCTFVCHASHHHTLLHVSLITTRFSFTSKNKGRGSHLRDGEPASASE